MSECPEREGSAPSPSTITDWYAFARQEQRTNLEASHATSRLFSQRSSEASSDNSCQSSTQGMAQGNGSPRRGRGRSGNVRGGRAPAGSTSSTSQASGVKRPILKPLASHSHKSGDSEASRRVLSAMESPRPPAGLNAASHNIHDDINYNHLIPRRPRNSGSVSPAPPAYPMMAGDRPILGPLQNHVAPVGSLASSSGSDWPNAQEMKIRLIGVPKSCWTREVYNALSQFGTVAKVEIQPGTASHHSFVTFQPPPMRRLLERIHIGSAYVRWEYANFTPLMIPSPVDPNKKYYETNILTADSVEFGTRSGETAMIKMCSFRTPGQVKVKLNLVRKELDIKFKVALDNKARNCRFSMPFALISRVYKVSFPAEPGVVSLIIPYDASPQFFVQKRDGDMLPSGHVIDIFSTEDKVWNEWNTWFRETDVMIKSVRKLAQEKPLMNHKGTAVIDIGNWNTYRITFPKVALAGAQFAAFADALADYGVAIEDLDHYTIDKCFDSPLWNLLEDEFHGTHSHLDQTVKHSDFGDLFARRHHVPFPIRYQLEVCLSNGYLKEHSITTEFLEKLSEMEMNQAVSLLERVADKQIVHYNPMAIFQLRYRPSRGEKVPSYCLMQRSVVVTPTMIHVATPIMETSNRITRKYAADADRFIRVKFSDEKTEGQLRNMPNGRAEAVFDRVHRAMQHGIVIAGRFYEFLAHGNSQFREHGAYFYAPTASKSAEDIRMALGKFDHIKTVAKFGARIGQCFSTTRAMSVAVKVRKIPDIERNGYTFTDGVGKISPFLAKMAAKELGLPRAFDDPPSLFQYRLGGCKGILAVDPSLLGSEVHIRPSQQKFEAEYTGLEIIRSSAHATAYFNRQIIMVLSNLGVPDAVFLKKQQIMVHDYERAMVDKAIAVDKLQSHIDMNQTTLTIAAMVLDGFMEAQDPFVMSLLHLWRSHTIKGLKEKARIAIDKGAFDLGCIDETATLKGHFDGPHCQPDASREERLANLPEIFLQVDNFKHSGNSQIIEGICILARNPSLHPGDLRIVRAVDVPALHHMKNAVVLPQTGDRDLANMCSGGDLDGDDYMVLWDEDLIPVMVNEAPMDFTPEKPVSRDKPIVTADISDFFVTYMKNDTLGQIAHAHLAQADLKPEGVMDETCIQLAQLHSQAVDYPKSGIPAVMDRKLRPNRWPHYMEKKHLPASKTYKSGKILGKLYDQVQLVDFKPQWENPFDERVLKAYELDEDMIDKAAAIKTSYDRALKRLMAKHSIQTEFEAWSVFILAHNHETRDYKFAEDFGRTIAALKDRFKEQCRGAAGMTSTMDWTRLGPFIAAMYAVTAREMNAALQECRSTKVVGGVDMPVRPMDPENMPLISFPWLFASELGRIATGNGAPLREAAFGLAGNQSLRQRKHDEAVRILVDAAPLESDQGTTQVGELLKLDFGTMDVPVDSGPILDLKGSTELKPEAQDKQKPPYNQPPELSPPLSFSQLSPTKPHERPTTSLEMNEHKSIAEALARPLNRYFAQLEAKEKRDNSKDAQNQPEEPQADLADPPDRFSHLAYLRSMSKNPTRKVSGRGDNGYQWKQERTASCSRNGSAVPDESKNGVSAGQDDVQSQKSDEAGKTQALGMEAASNRSVPAVDGNVKEKSSVLDLLDRFG